MKKNETKEQSIKKKTILCTKCNATDSRRFQCLNQVDPQIKGELYAEHFKAQPKTKTRAAIKASQPNQSKHTMVQRKDRRVSTTKQKRK